MEPIDPPYGPMTKKTTDVRDLAVIGNRRTAAMVASDGAIVWYCPGRFDRPSLFASLLDPEQGGAWTIDLPGSTFAGRDYLEDSAVLETHFELGAGGFMLTDWMPLGDGCPRGICRELSAPPRPVVMTLAAAPDYARGRAEPRPTAGGGLCIDGRHWLYASEPIATSDGIARIEVPAGRAGWAVLVDAPLEWAGPEMLADWRAATLAAWQDLASQITYRGPFEREVAQSLRALRLLTYAPNGGIIAAATTSLPEIAGGERNYDYRYVWLRDTAMTVSALVRAGHGPAEQRFLDFICRSRKETPGEPLLPPFVSLDFNAAPDVTHLDLAGYADSRPVRIGNDANRQLQLDGFANVLLAAKLIYARHDARENWETVRRIADFLAEHWSEPDYGIWEEHEVRQYTTGKVIVSCGLRHIADFADDHVQAEKWRAASRDIDAYVAANCMSAEGAFLVYAGGEAVDVSSVLFPIWGYTPADSPEMLATMRVLERDYCQGDLYWRHLEELEVKREGAFLAATLWVAQYWVMRRDLPRARTLLEAALEYATDLGFFAEEADPASMAMLGNFPQTFVHASFIGAVIDYRDAQGEPA